MFLIKKNKQNFIEIDMILSKFQFTADRMKKVIVLLIS